MSTLVVVPSHQIIETWPFIFPLIKRAVERDGGRHTIDEVFDDLVNSRAQLWVGFDEEDRDAEMICVTKFIEYPEFRSFLIEYLSGSNISAWLERLPEIEKWAKEQGAEVAEGWMRKGFERALPDYKKKMSFMVKDLT